MKDHPLGLFLDSIREFAPSGTNYLSMFPDTGRAYAWTESCIVSVQVLRLATLQLNNFTVLGYYFISQPAQLEIFADTKMRCSNFMISSIIFYRVQLCSSPF